MRFLADAGISPRTVEFLKQLGHEATHVRTLGLQRARDAELIDRSRADSSVVLTFDLDFGDILALGVLDKPSVIILRLSDERTESVNHRLSVVLAERAADLEASFYTLLDSARIHPPAMRSRNGSTCDAVTATWIP
jgi:predicted nuclease of predicted toxin-antitoxin system